ncbi:sigma-70 family RNA polymerase sigma factor [Nocardioides sp. KR10-350]|uniref:sigma-70 family RNA polymerase sigma factor n=1 Tax=Nocardioides cheoyonin TaxID=3156615 RepID=UPI0032B354A0
MGEVDGTAPPRLGAWEDPSVPAPDGPGPAALAACIASAGLDDATRRHITDECLHAADRAPSPEVRRDLLDRVVVVNLHVAHAVAMRYRGRGVATEDLEQIADMALVQASRSFEPARGHDFLTYAVPTIRGAILHHFRDQAWAVRPPGPVRDLQLRALDAADVLEARRGEATVVAIACHLGEPVPDVAEALAARGCFRPSSLDAPRGEGGIALADLQSADSRDLERVEARLTLAAAVHGLEDRAKRILYLRFFEGRTQQEIGEDVGISQMQVSRELRRILTLLRDAIEADLGEAV